MKKLAMTALLIAVLSVPILTASFSSNTNYMSPAGKEVTSNAS